jgi:hypothetical protein
VLVVVLGFLWEGYAYSLLLGQSLAKTLATGLLVIAGAGMVVVGFFPCDAGCVDVTTTGRLHSVFSMPGAIGLPVAGHAVGPGVPARRAAQHSLAGDLVLAWAGHAGVRVVTRRQ